MSVQKLNIKSIVDAQTKANLGKKPKEKKEAGGGLLGDLAGGAIAAMPFIPAKFKVMAGVGVFFLIYGVGSFIADVIGLF
jgi:hypothetical protein